MPVRFAYHPGNVGRESCAEVEDTIVPLANTLGIELVEIQGGSSDGAGIIKQGNKTLQLALNARNIAIAQESECDVMTCCATSQGVMSDTIRTLDSNEIIRSQINRALQDISGIEYEPGAGTKHLIHVLVEDVGLDKISEKVLNPLELKVACYYGPNMQKDGACSSDDSFNPTYMEDLVNALGGTAVEHDLRCASIGTPSLLINQDTAMRMTAAVLTEAKSSGAQVLMTACTLSHSLLDSYQMKAGKVSGKDTKIPIVHVSELVAFALGHYLNRFSQLKTRAKLIGS